MEREATLLRIVVSRKMAKGALPIPTTYYDVCTVEHTLAISTPNIPRKAAYTTGSINGNSLTSGASCSVVCFKYILLADVQPLTDQCRW